MTASSLLLLPSAWLLGCPGHGQAMTTIPQFCLSAGQGFARLHKTVTWLSVIRAAWGGTSQPRNPREIPNKAQLV